jgi:dCMP deaminase
MKNEHSIFMNIAKEISRASTCCKRQVGVVIISPDNRIISTGYNGVVSGAAHCTTTLKTIIGHYVDSDYDNFKNRIFVISLGNERFRYEIPNDIPLSESMFIDYVYNDMIEKDYIKRWHSEWSKQNEIHAEINALLNATIPSLKNCSMYVTLSPCIDCAKAIVAAGIKNVYYLGDRSNKSDDGIEYLKKIRTIQLDHEHYKKIL